MPSRIAPVVLGAALVSCTAVGRAGADDVPFALRGTWGRDGRCDVPADRLTITARTAGWGEGPFKPVVYDPDEKAIHWDEEYDVDNFVPTLAPDVLVHNTEGFHMPGQRGYARCGAGMVRVLPWPPFKPGPAVPGPGKQPGHGTSER